MRPHQGMLRSGTVYAYARHLLSVELELRDYKQAVPAPVLASVLLLAACWQTSLSAAAAMVRAAPSHESVRKAAHCCLPPRPSDLLGRLLAGLRRTLPDHLGRVPRVMALDLHQRPFHSKKNRRGTTRRKLKGGTHNSFTYATLAALTPSGRFTIGLLPVRPHMRLTTILQRLFEQAAAAGVSVAYLLADKEFYAAEAIDWLQRHNLPFLMPAARKGAKGKGGNRHLFEQATPVGWYEYSWTAPVRRRDFKTGKRHKRGELTVTVRMCVARHHSSGEPLVYASWGLSKWPPAVVVQEYRRRFGIEVSYRQMGQCLARTTSGNEKVRLLLVGVALMLCNLFSWLHSQLLRRGPVSQPRLALAALRLAQLLLAVQQAAVASLGGLVDAWPTQLPLPPELAAFDHPDHWL